MSANTSSVELDFYNNDGLQLALVNYLKSTKTYKDYDFTDEQKLNAVLDELAHATRLSNYYENSSLGPKFKFTELDFFKNKELLIDYLRQQERFKDYDFAGSNLNVLLDVLAYNTHLNNYYAHSVFSEMFLDTAKWRENLNSHAKELNYLPQSRASAEALVNLSFTALDNPSFITIPKYTKFTGICNGKNYFFYNKDSATVYPINGTYTYLNLKVYEGRIVNDVFTVDKLNPRRYYLNSDTIDVNSVRVYVRENNLPNSPEVEFVRRQDVYGAKKDSNVFFLQPYLKYRYEVEFGKDVFGYEPKHGNVVRLEYRTTLGEEANNVRKFTTDKIAGYPVLVTTADQSRGGTERESEESIRFFAPKSIQIQNRAVTESDYEIMLRNEFGEIEAVSVYGGEEANPPQYGRVVIAVDVKNQNGVTSTQKRRYTAFLSDKTPIAVEPIIVSPDFMWIDVSTIVTYNTAFTYKTGTDIRNIVLDAINTHSVNNLNKFKATCRFSHLSRDIDGADEFVISNELKIRGVIDYTPVINVSESFNVKFANTIQSKKIVNEEDYYDTNFESTPFVYETGEVSCKLLDDGNGKINVVSFANNKPKIIKSIGTIDYTTGEVNIKNFKVKSYSGSTMKFYVKTLLSDISSPITRILGIRPEDVRVAVNGIRA